MRQTPRPNKGYTTRSAAVSGAPETVSRDAGAASRPTKAAAAARAAARQRWMRFRLLLLGGVVACAAALLIYRAYVLQQVRSPMLAELAEAQYLKHLQLAPKRGTIRDRHGVELAVSVEIYSVWANPRELKRREVPLASVGEPLAALLGLAPDLVSNRLNRDKLFVWIKRHIQPKEAEALQALDLPGVYLTREARRFYPHRELASHVLGFADIDGVGKEGLERHFEASLRGSILAAPAIRDRDGNVVFSERLLDDRAAEGDDLMLTLDRAIQHRAEQELFRTVRASEARAGSLVAIDPATGEILALANYPTFNPNEPGHAAAESRRNRAVTDRFEPGSTLKPFTVAAALAARVLRPSDLIDCEGGRMVVADQQIHDTHPHGLLKPAEILTYSSNIGTAKVGRLLGKDKLYNALRRFGFGALTGVPLPAETEGQLTHYDGWFEMDAATIAFGQGMSVTVLQLALATAALANGGNLMEPRLVKRITSASGREVKTFAPTVRRSVLPSRSARLVAEMLTAVTGASGTGSEASLEHHLAAGKTGTAQKAKLTGRGYERDKWIASFVGFAPLESPRIAMAVVIDEPMAVHAGGVLAAPVFRRVTDAALRRLGVPATGTRSLIAKLSEVRSRVKAEGQPRETPRSAEPVPAGAARVPSLTALGVKDAVTRLARAGLLPQVEGSGIVIQQDPEAHTIVEKGDRVRLTLEPYGVVARHAHRSGALGGARGIDPSDASTSEVVSSLGRVPVSPAAAPVAPQ